MCHSSSDGCPEPDRNAVQTSILTGKPGIERLGQTIYRLRWTGMGGILLRNLLTSWSSASGEWRIFNSTLIKAAHLLHDPVGSGAPPLFPPLPLPLRGGGRFSVGKRQGDIASVGGACCDARGGACLISRWRVVGADKMPGCMAAAGPPRARAPSSFLLPPPLR